MSLHFRHVCKDHGIVVSQCRCPGPATPEIVACPDTPWHNENAAKIEMDAVADKVAEAHRVYDWDVEGL